MTRLAPSAVRVLVAVAALAGALLGVLTHRAGDGAPPQGAATLTTQPRSATTTEFDVAVPATVARLNRTRRDGRRRLAHARTPRAQAAAAATVERAYMTALTRLQPLRGHGRARPRAILDAMSRAAAAYGRMSDAARHGRQAAYARAARAVAAGEARLRALL